MRCFVPNCENKNTTGLLFPQEYELRNTWLKSLRIVELTPDNNSFVCLDHFKKSDIEDIINEDGVLERKVNPNAIPRLFELDEVIEKETKEFLEFKSQKFTSEKNDDDTTQVQNEFDSTNFQQFPEGDFIINDQTQLYQSQDVQNQGNEEENQNFFNVQHDFPTQEIFTAENQSDQIYTSEGQNILPSEPEYVPEQPLSQENFNDEQQQNVSEVKSFQIVENENFDPPPTNDESIDETHENIARMVAENCVNETIRENDVVVPENSGNIVMQWFVPNEIKDEEKNSDDQITITYQQEIENSQNEGVNQEISIETNRENVTFSEHESVVGTEVSDEHCRLCMSKEQVNVNILDNIKDNIMVLEAIQSCLHPLEVSLEDPFSKKICNKCLEILRSYYDFRQNCIEIDVEQKRSYEISHPQFKFNEKLTSKKILSPNEKSYKQGDVVRITRSDFDQNYEDRVKITPSNRKLAEYYVRSSNDEKNRFKQIITKKKKPDDVQVYRVKNRKENGSTYYRKRPAVPIRISSQKLNQSQIEAIAKKPPLPTAKQLKIQEELKKVIEGKMSKDDLSVDHVIVRVVSDDESDEYVPSIKRQKVNVPVIESKKEYNTMRFGQNEIVIPKSIRVSIPEKFESNRGIFPLFIKFGPFGTEFAVIDGYLFEHGLRKGTERNLKCVVVACPSNAVQKLLTTGKYEPRGFVKTPHNHQQPSNSEMKKQMCYHVMKRKMQREKGVNFRNVYDQICQKDPQISDLVSLRSLINEICKQQLCQKSPTVRTFDEFYKMIEYDSFFKLQFTHNGKQFYQEKFEIPEEGSKAVVFANVDVIKRVSRSKLMYIDASFRITPGEDCPYQLVTVLVWVDDCYYPIMFALVNNRSMEIFKKIFGYLHDTLAPNLCPEEIVTDYEANIYYAIGETYLNSHIGGSVFYYTQNLYKKICELGLARELEATPYFRHIYHMLLMLPLLPVNTISDGLENVEIQAQDIGVIDKTAGLFKHVREQWMEKVTPDLFCVHRLENRINENVLSPFKKLRDYLLITKGKTEDKSLTIVHVVEKLIDLENFLRTNYTSDNRKSFGRDLSSLQKKNVMKAWQYIETHPKININHFFLKVIGYIRCMENQLWIWGYYKFTGKVMDDLINASNFSIVNMNEIVGQNDEEIVDETLQERENSGLDGTIKEENDQDNQEIQNGNSSTVVVEAVVGPSGEFVISNPENNQEIEKTIFKYVYND